MRAWVLTRHGDSPDTFELRSLPTPKPGPGQVRVKVLRFGLNFADVMAMLGLYRDCPPLPAVLGYDVAGVIDELGPDVDDWKLGDRVFGLSRFGGYAEYAITEAGAITKLPDSLTLEVGVALATQGVTAQYMANYIQPLRQGEHVLIHAAAGGVGTLMVQVALHAGCIVYGTAGSASKLEYLRNMGVHHPINYRDQDFFQVISRDGDQQPLDAVFDPIGGKSVKLGMKLLKPGGRMVTFGGSSFIGKGNIVTKMANFLASGFYHPLVLTGGSRSVIGVNMLRLADHKPEVLGQLMAQTAELASRKVFRPEIFSVVPANQFKESLAMLQNRATIGKLVVSWES